VNDAETRPWNELHEIVLKQIERQTNKESILARTIERGFRHAGVRISGKERTRIKGAVAAYFTDSSSRELESLEIKRRGDKHKVIAIEADDLRSTAAASHKAIAAAMPKIAKDIAKQSQGRYLEDTIFAYWANEYSAEIFRKRLSRTYRSAFKSMGCFNVACIEIGRLMLGALTSKKGVRQTPLRRVLFRLHFRGCLVAEEIRALLELGFCDAAMARWRTLHEITVCAAFLQERGSETVQRYLKYEAIERKKLLDSELKLTPCELAFDIGPLEKSVDQLSAQYGVEYTKDYGWATQTLGKTHVTFRDIEHATNFSAARLYYQQASKAIHASPLSLSYRPSVDLLAGSGDPLEFAMGSNVGLVVPATLASKSLNCLTLCMLSTAMNMDRLVAMHFITKLASDVPKKFTAVERRIKKREEKYRSKRASK
jgi:hypothetical protein